MKKLMIAFTAVGILVVGAFAAIAIDSSGTAVAQSDTPQTEAPATGAQATENPDVPAWVDEVLDGLINGGVLTDETASELRTEVPNLFDLLDQMGFSTNSEQQFNPEDFAQMFESFGFPDGFQGLDFFGPDGFDLGGLAYQFEDFDFENFEFPEGFAHPDGITPESFKDFRLPNGGFGLLDGLSGLSFADLQDAMQNGTLTDLIDTEAIISDIGDKLDQAVENGRLTREQADEKLAQITDKLDAIGNGELPFFGLEPGGPHDPDNLGSSEPDPQPDPDAQQDA